MFERLNAIPWALATLPEPWRTIVEHSRVWRNDTTRDPANIPEVRAFVRRATTQAGHIATERH